MANRPGFTMIELIVSLVILGVAIVGLQVVTSRMLQTTDRANRRTIAAQIAEDRLDLIRSDPDYGRVAARFTESGTTIDEPAGFTRTTRFLHQYDSTASGVTDYLRVTVTVDGTGLPEPVARTISIGRP